MTDDFSLEVKTFDRDSFVKLFEYILLKGIRKVYFSSRSEEISSNVKMSLPPRIDFTITGVKHMVFPYNGTKMDVRMLPGEAHFAPPMTWKQPEWDELHRMASIVYTPDYIRFTFIDYHTADGYYSTHGANVFYHTSLPVSSAGKAVIHALSLLAEEPGGDDEAAVELLTALLRLSITTLRQDQERAPDKSNQTFLRVDNFLHENYLHGITRASVAEEFRLTPSYVSRLYAEFGESAFNDTLRRLRMEHAAMLLKNTTFSIDEITEACAYSSTTFFIAAFKKIYGVSPGRFRRQYGLSPH